MCPPPSAELLARDPHPHSSHRADSSNVRIYNVFGLVVNPLSGLTIVTPAGVHGINVNPTWLDGIRINMTPVA